MKFGRKARRADGPGDLPSAPEDAGGSRPPESLQMVLDQRVLLLTSGDDEPSAQAWRAQLAGEGVPFDCLTAGVDQLIPATLERGVRHGRYQAVILATDSLVRLRNDVYESSLDPQEWVTLRDYLRAYGVRQISAYTTPGPAVGLQPAIWAGDVGARPAHVTSAGRAVFVDLVGDVPLSPGTYGYQTAVAEGADFTTLVSGPQGSPVVGVFVHSDGREEMVVTIASGPFSRHLHLLGHGMLSWAIGTARVGHHGYFLSVQVDDVLLGAPVPMGSDPIRLTSDDVLATARWSLQSQVRLDFAYNGWGSVTATMDHAVDPLTESLIVSAAHFNWINHTFGHLDLDDVSATVITEEITRNLIWASDHGIDVPADTLVTGAHSGLTNPAMTGVAEQCGIRWIASDASRTPSVQRLGEAHLVPRHPVNIPLDICTHDALAGHRIAHSAAATVDTLERREVLEQEADLIVSHLLSNDPRPHYTHQNALVRDRLLLGLLDDALQSYRALVRIRPVQMTLAEAGRELLRRAAWSEAVAAGVLSIRRTDSGVDIANCSDQDVAVPWTAPGGGSRWMTVAPGDKISPG